MNTCPVSAAHRRLLDAHELWHQLGEAYMDPTSFRRILNSCIPELRNVSWLIQKQKSQLENFDVWYPIWQDKVANRRVMRWIVNSRNRVVKEGDLALLSVASVSYQSLSHRLSVSEFAAPPKFTIDQMMAMFAQIDGTPDTGLLTIRRAWRDYALSGYELLSALSEAWLACAQLVTTAHGNVDTATCFGESDWSRECITSSLAYEDCACLLQSRQYTELSLDLEAGNTKQTRLIPISLADHAAEDSTAIYGDLPTGYSRSDAIGDIPRLAAMGLRILRVDASLMSTVHYYGGEKAIEFTGFVANDHVDVIRQMALIADRAAELEADSVAISTEVWYANYDAEQHGVRPTNRGDRLEALLIDAVRSDGTGRSVIIPFTTAADGSRTFENPSGGTGAVPMFEPLRKLWNLKRWWHLTEEVAVAGVPSATDLTRKAVVAGEDRTAASEDTDGSASGDAAI